MTHVARLEASDGPVFLPALLFSKEVAHCCYCLPSQPVSERVHGSHTPPPPPPPNCAGPMVRRVHNVNWKALNI